MFFRRPGSRRAMVTERCRGRTGPAVTASLLVHAMPVRREVQTHVTKHSCAVAKRPFNVPVKARATQKEKK